MNLRDKILSLPKLANEAVYVPEWDATVYVRRLTVKQSEAIERNTGELLVNLVVDENDQPIFKPEDADKLMESDSVPARRITNVFNGYFAEKKSSTETT